MDEIDKIRNEFMAVLSHELRAPLSTIKEGVAQLADEIAGELNLQQKEIITTVRHEVDRMADFMADLLDFKTQIRKHDLDLKKIGQDAINSMRPYAAQKGIQLELRIPTELSSVHADPHKLTRVFINLLWNAIKFTPQGGRVVISAKSQESDILIEVADTGAGIHKEHQDKIFEKFFQSDHALGAETGGAGIGLAIVKEIIDGHNGKIWVESEIGKGSTFAFTLPKVLEA
jgi:signal transduction histidine kinase